MDIRKLLIADESAVFTAALADMLGGVYDIRQSHDGVRTLELLEQFCPDVLVLDLMMPGLDGISLLNELAVRSQRPAILITSWLASPYIVGALDTLKVDYVMIKPCNLRAMRDRIYDLTREAEEQDQILPGPGLTVANMLLTLGISARNSGFRCLETAVQQYARNPGQSMTKELYPEVGRQNNCSSSAAERSIRGSIQSAWSRRDEAVWSRWFQPFGGGVPRPTNTEFIATLAEQLRRRQREQAAG